VLLLIKKHFKMKLHEAIVAVLIESGQCLTASQIAEIINQRKTYIRGDGNPLPSSQISARVNNYPNLFSKDIVGKICLNGKSPITSKHPEFTSNASFSTPKELNAIFNSFRLNRFDPKIDSDSKIADKAGNYIICLKQCSKLPPISNEPEFNKFEGLDVIYTGIASSSLRSRDYRQHFIGNNAGRSTLRKSLGALFGYEQIPRDTDPTTGKTKFGDVDEQTLSDWMKNNLILFFLPTKDYNNLEINLINHFNPPLNLMGNHNPINADFRRLLSTLRGQKE
jgi:hypothetical protein